MISRMISPLEDVSLKLRKLCVSPTENASINLLISVFDLLILKVSLRGGENISSIRDDEDKPMQRMRRPLRHAAKVYGTTRDYFELRAQISLSISVTLEYLKAKRFELLTKKMPIVENVGKLRIV